MLLGAICCRNIESCNLPTCHTWCLGMNENSSSITIPQVRKFTAKFRFTSQVWSCGHDYGYDASPQKIVILTAIIVTPYQLTKIESFVLDTSVRMKIRDMRSLCSRERDRSVLINLCYFFNINQYLLLALKL